MREGFKVKITVPGRAPDEWYVSLDDPMVAMIAACDEAGVKFNVSHVRISGFLTADEVDRLGLVSGQPQRAAPSSAS